MRARLLVSVISTIAACGFFHPQAASASTTSQWAWSSKISGVDVSGTVTFSSVQDGPGWDLTIVLQNTADQLPTSTAEILTGLYFNLTPQPNTTDGGLSMYSAFADQGMYTTGSAQNTASPNTNGTHTPMCAAGAGGTGKAPNATNCTVSGGWELAFNNSGIGGGASATEHYGIGTSGQGGVFHGNQVGTFDYGIAPFGPTGIDPAQGGGLSGAYPAGYAAGQATFVITGLTAADFTISAVEGAYGTAPEGTPAATQTTSSTPEPASGALLTIAIAALGFFGRRRMISARA